MRDAVRAVRSAEPQLQVAGWLGDTASFGAKVPPLEASEESLKKFAAERAPAPPSPPPAQPPVSASYPPLEAPAR